MINPNPGVPERIPDVLREGIDLLVLAVVDQNEIDIRAGADLAPGEGTYGG